MPEPIAAFLTRRAEFDLNGDDRVDAREGLVFDTLDTNGNGWLDSADNRVGTPSGRASLQVVHAAGMARHDSYERSRNPFTRTALRSELLSAFKIVAALAPPGSTQNANACHNLREYNERTSYCGPTR